MRLKEELLLSLESTRWSELEHAYGSAHDIPELLQRLSGVPKSEDDGSPWFDLWSSLAHQGDVYSASFAAVPHVVQALASSPENADFNYFQFPAWVEICRQKKGMTVPDDLTSSYFEALSRLPSLAAAASSREWDSDFLICVLSAVAAAKGQVTIAEAVQELSPEVAEEFLQWLFER